MPAYIVTLWEESLAPWSTDPTELDRYADQIEATFVPYGGRYVRLSDSARWLRKRTRASTRADAA
jgi:hypothetical protein